MQLFDIIKLIFTNKKDKWNTVAKIEKSRNFFMINRIMSIQFPVQANQFNKIKVVPANVVNWWHDTLSSRFSRPPQWLYTETKKKAKPQKNNIKNLDDVESFIREKYCLTKKDLETLRNFYPDRYSNWISDISDQIGIKNKEYIKYEERK